MATENNIYTRVPLVHLLALTRFAIHHHLISYISVRKIFLAVPQIAQQLSNTVVCLRSVWRSVAILFIWVFDMNLFCMIKSHITQIATDLKQTFKQTPFLDNCCAICDTVLHLQLSRHTHTILWLGRRSHRSVTHHIQRCLRGSHVPCILYGGTLKKGSFFKGIPHPTLEPVSKRRALFEKPRFSPALASVRSVCVRAGWDAKDPSPLPQNHNRAVTFDLPQKSKNAYCILCKGMQLL